jgi:hypothetical protein
VHKHTKQGPPEKKETEEGKGMMGRKTPSKRMSRERVSVVVVIVMRVFGEGEREGEGVQEETKG